MADRLVISLCMGSSCFARGNAKLLEELEDFIDKNHWQERISLTGSRCRNCCKEGPHLAIDGQSYSGINAAALKDLLLKKMETAGERRN